MIFFRFSKTFLQYFMEQQIQRFGQMFGTVLFLKINVFELVGGFGRRFSEDVLTPFRLLVKTLIQV